MGLLILFVALLPFIFIAAVLAMVAFPPLFGILMSIGGSRTAKSEEEGIKKSR